MMSRLIRNFKANAIVEQPAAINESPVQADGAINDQRPLDTGCPPVVTDKDRLMAAAAARVAEWGTGIAKLEFQRRPAVMHPNRWTQFLRAALPFLNSTRAIRAAAWG